MLDFMFYVFAGVALFGAIVMAAHKSIVHSAFGLVGALFGVAGLYWTLGADFLGATQLLLYVGGVTVLLLFAVMLSPRDASRASGMRHVFAIAVLALLGVTLSSALDEVATVVGTDGVIDENGAWIDTAPTTSTVGEAFVDPERYLVPFEVLAVLLLVVLVGAVTLARRQTGQHEGSQA